MLCNAPNRRLRFSVSPPAVYAQPRQHRRITQHRRVQIGIRCPSAEAARRVPHGALLQLVDLFVERLRARKTKMWSVFFSEQLIFDRALLGFTSRARSTEADGVYRSAERPNVVLGLAPSPNGKFIYFSQNIRDATLWLARLAK
jgi:hypothetical protein